ncbi:GH92 family glycosyl hydrolase [Arthrobacter dokdonensis]|uniref:GH92 family glycosyl hydrolase n=1 Tax=Arthrobacter dokdonellae TaxID=2211210 RepID=UPI001D13203D|nr:GH92 family glycosyl hydrolase [Arthrobacter dokdonellae]
MTVLEVPGLAGRTIKADERLMWAWFPERSLPAGRIEPDDSDLDHFWDATAFAVDLVFDDGTRLSEHAVMDQYGTLPSADAQFTARTAWVDQWNRRTVQLDAVLGRTVARAEAVLGVATNGAGASPLAIRGWIDEVLIGPNPPRPSRPLDLVRTTRGTHSSGRFSRGNTAPLVAVPHGGVFGLPMTRADESRWPYSYHEHNRVSDNRPTIEAFATSHLPSPWMGDRGVFQLMPSPLAQPPTGRTERALAFDHDSEQDGPHRYSVRLDAGEAGIVEATMTAGDFALGLRFIFPGATDQASIIVDHHGAVRDVHVHTEGADTVIEVLLDDRAESPQHYVHLRVPNVLADRTSVVSGLLRGSLLVAVDGPVDVLLGISTVSFPDAAANLAAAGGFDAMLGAAEQQWAEKLGTLEVEGAGDDRLVSLYSGLYRLFLYPNRAGETALTGAPHYRSPYGETLERSIRAVPGREVVEAPFTTTNGFWDTYRTAWPLLGLLTPRSAGTLAQGFLQHFVDSGWMPRWSAPGAEDVMTGTTSDTVLADLLAKHVPGIDPELAYRAAVKNATVPAPDARVGRKGILPGAFRGYVDTATDEGMSWTLDAAINDWSISVLARLLADRAEPGSSTAERLAAEAEWFTRRSLQYRNVFHPDLGFFLGRTMNGAWRVAGRDFDPDEWGHDYTETNAWGTMFTAPHDGAGVAALHGGENGLMSALDRFYRRRETGSSEHCGSYGFAIHEMTEARDIRMGMLGLSNQPAHHIPFFPMFAGRHDDAHRVLLECVDRLFVGSDNGQGYPGDEDNGEMSAWYVFVTIGIYPLVPATGTYVLIPPSVHRTELRLDGGATTVLEVVPGTEGGRFIRSVKVNGEPWSSISIDHDVIASGAHVEFELASEPCGWAADSRPPSASSLHGFSDGPIDVLPRGAHPLTDDEGRTAVRLTVGESVDFPVSLGAASLYTLTAAEPGAYAWSVSWVTADGVATAADERDAEIFEWSGQTRVFRIHGGVRDGFMRLTASTSCLFTQAELIPVSGPAQAAGGSGADDGSQVARGGA